MIRRLLGALGVRAAMLVVSSVAVLLNVRVVLDALGSTASGAYFTIVSIGQFLLIWDFGLAMGVAMTVAGRDHPNVANCFRVASRAARALSGYFLVVLAASAAIADWICGSVLHASASSRDAVVVGLTAAAASLVLQPYVRALEGMGKTALVQLCDGFRPMLTVVGGLLAARAHAGLLGFIAIWGAANCMPGTAVFLASLSARMRAGRATRTEDNDPSVRELGRLGIGYQAATTGNALNTMLDQAIVSAQLGPSSVVSYQALSRAIQLARSLFGGCWLFFWPRMFGDASLRSRRREYRSADIGLLLLGAVLAVGLVAVGPTLIHWWLGTTTSAGLLATTITGGVILVYAAETMPSAVTTKPRAQLRKAAYTGISGLANLGLSWWLAGRIGYVGPLLATLATYGICYVLPLRRMAARRLIECHDEPAKENTSSEATVAMSAA